MHERMRVFDDPHAIAAGVIAIDGEGSRIEPMIEDDGYIKLPEDMTWGGVESYGDIHADAGVLVQRFELSVALQQGRMAVVTQRGSALDYDDPTGLLSMSGVKIHTFPACRVRSVVQSGWRKDRYGPVAVWTETMGTAGGPKGPNRADIWLLAENGDLELFQILVITLDNGKSFRLVGTPRWRGHVSRREDGDKYTPRSLGGPVEEAAYANGNIRLVMDQFAFRPEVGFGCFESRWNILGKSELVSWLSTLDLPTWDGDEGSLHPDFSPRVSLGENEGVVKFQSYGLAQGSLAYVTLADPIKTSDGMWKDGRVHGAEIRLEPDEQGLRILESGDTVRFDGWEESHDRRNPCLLDVEVVQRRADIA